MPRNFIALPDFDCDSPEGNYVRLGGVGSALEKFLPLRATYEGACMSGSRMDGGGALRISVFVAGRSREKEIEKMVLKSTKT